MFLFLVTFLVILPNDARAESTAHIPTLSPGSSYTDPEFKFQPNERIFRHHSELTNFGENFLFNGDCQFAPIEFLFIG